MIKVKDLYDDVVIAVLKDGNGNVTFDIFNRFSKLAEIKLIDWLSGDTAGQQLPEPYVTQKNKDWLSPFITPFPTNAVNGKISKPSDYYVFENMYMIGNFQTQTSDCSDEDDDTEKSDCNTPIELLDGAQFNTRCRTYIQGLAPSFTKPIAKEVGNIFEFKPTDIGSVTLEYIRYPKYANIVEVLDEEFNETVIDENASTDYEWDDNARPMLIYFIVDQFANRTSNQAQKEFNTASKNIRK